MNTFSLKLTDEQIDKLKKSFKDAEAISNNEYIDKLYKLSDCTISRKGCLYLR